MTSYRMFPILGMMFVLALQLTVVFGTDPAYPRHYMGMCTVSVALLLGLYGVAAAVEDGGGQR